MTRRFESVGRHIANVLIAVLAASLIAWLGLTVLSLGLSLVICTSPDSMEFGHVRSCERFLLCWYPLLGVPGLGAAVVARLRHAASRWVVLLAALPLCAGGAAIVQMSGAIPALWHHEEVRLARAARAGDVSKVARLLEKGVPTGGVPGVTPAPLDEAVDADRVETFALLVRAGARPEREAFPQLLVEILDGKQRVSRPAEWVEAILASGKVDPRWKDKGGSLLHHALALDDPAVLRALVRHGADPASPGGTLGVTPLCLAASAGHWRSALVFIDAVQQDRFCLQNALEAYDTARGGSTDPGAERIRAALAGPGP